MSRASLIFCVLLLVVLGCGGSGGVNNSATITLNPPESSLLPGGARQFTVEEGVLVDWSAPDGGTVVNGLFTAPNTTGFYRVVATSLINPTVSDTANVTVANVQVDVAPASLSVAAGSVNTDAFKAFVSGTMDHSVTWAAAGGSIAPSTPDPSGNPRATFTAGTTPGTYLVRATSTVDTSVSGVAQVTVLGNSGLGLNPASAAATATVPNNTVTLIAVMTDASGNVDETTPLTWEMPVNPVGATLTGSALRQRTFTVPTSFTGTAICQVRVRTPNGVAAISTIQVTG